MEEYYTIRSLEKNEEPILIVKVEKGKVQSVYTLDDNKLIEWGFEDIFVNQVNQFLILEEDFFNDKKNAIKAKAKLESIYQHVKDRLENPKNIYYMPYKKTSDTNEQIEKSIEFIKTKGLTLNEKIDSKKSEISILKNKLKAIQNKNKDKASKLGILSMIGVLTAMYFLSDSIDSFPFTLKVIISASVTAVPVFITIEHELNKNKKEIEKINEQISLAQSYLKEYKLRNQLRKKAEPKLAPAKALDTTLLIEMAQTELKDSKLSNQNQNEYYKWLEETIKEMCMPQSYSLEKSEQHPQKVLKIEPPK